MASFLYTKKKQSTLDNDNGFWLCETAMAMTMWL